MSDQEQDVQVETLTVEEIEAFRVLLAAKAEEPAADEPEETPTDSAAEPTSTVGFAEKLAQQEKELTENFTAKLETAAAKTEKLTERLDTSERLRRLREFTDVAATYSLPVSGTEQFGEDLMAIKDSVPEEVYTRLTTMLRASDEAVKQGELFSQFSRTAPVETGDPFLSKVEQYTAKLTADDLLLDADEAYATAMKKVAERHPSLAKAYALRGGA